MRLLQKFSLSGMSFRRVRLDAPEFAGKHDNNDSVAAAVLQCHWLHRAELEGRTREKL